MILTLLILEYTFAFLTKRVSYTDYGLFTSIGYRYKKLHDVCNDYQLMLLLKLFLI